MRTVMKDTFSSHSNVTSGVLQGQILASIAFQIYTNDMQCSVTSYMNLSADDAKWLKVKSQDDCWELQRDIDRIYEWSKNGNWYSTPKNAK